MNNQNDFWSQFEPSTQPYASAQSQDPKAVVQEAEASDFDWNQFEPVQETSFPQKIASSAPVQFGLGVAKTATWYADIYKNFAHAEGMQELQELEERGIPVDREKYIKGLEDALSYIPTQELAEKGFQKITGISLEKPEGTMARDIGEYFNPKKLLEKGIQGAIKKGAKELTTSGIALGAEKTAEELGATKIVSTLIGGVTKGVSSVDKGTPKLSKEGAELEKISTKHELPKMAGIYKENPSKNAILSKEILEKSKEKLAISSKKAIEEIIDKKIPLKNAIKQGHSPKDLYTSAYEMAYERASKSQKHVPMKHYAGWIKNKINEIESQVPSPSIGKEAQIKILKEQYKDLIEKNPKYTEKVSKLLDEFGIPLRTPKEPKYKVKQITPKQVLEQNKHYNENLEKLYRKPEWLGSEDDVADIYRQMKEQLQTSLDLSDNKGVGLPFRIANNIYAQDKKIDRLTKILKPGFDDPTKLKKILESKKAGFLERDLGKDGIKSIEEISKYSQAAKEKIFSAVKQKGKLLEEMGTVGKAAQFIAANMLGGEYVATGLAALVTSKDIFGRIQGRMLLQPKIRKSYENWLKAISSGSEAATKRYASELDKNIEEEYGNFENLLR